MTGMLISMLNDWNSGKKTPKIANLENCLKTWCIAFQCRL